MYNPAKANQYVSPDATGNVYAPAIYLTEPRGKSASELQLLFESWNANVSICLLERNSSISTIIACTGLIWSELASSVEHNLYSIFLGSDWGSTGVQLQPACPPSRDPCRWLKPPFESRTNRFIFFSCQAYCSLCHQIAIRRLSQQCQCSPQDSSASYSSTRSVHLYCQHTCRDMLLVIIIFWIGLDVTKGDHECQGCSEKRENEPLENLVTTLRWIPLLST